MSSLQSLLAIIATGINEIEAAYTAAGDAAPSLDDPSPDARRIPDGVQLTTDLVVSAAHQLIATLRSPALYLTELGAGMYVTASLGIAVSANVPEILREAGPQGVHADAIGAKAGASPDKIARIIRLLATRHVFREVSPDVFANNRVSAFLDTGKSVKYIQARPLEKHEGTSGFPAMIGLMSDELLHGSAYMSDHILNPKTAFIEEPDDTAFHLAFGTKEPFYKWLRRPENELRFRRFGAAMKGRAERDTGIPGGGFRFGDLKTGDLVVDVGGGIGSLTMALAKACPYLRFIVQELPQVAEEGTKFFEREAPDILGSGQVKFQVHDFFLPQPVVNPAVFILRVVTHNWPTSYIKRMLQQLRAAAQPTTRVVIMEHLLRYAAPITDTFSDIIIDSSASPAPPPPLLPNLGAISFVTQHMDLVMMAQYGGAERTIGGFVELVKGTGWKVDTVHYGYIGNLGQIILTPDSA